MKLASAIARSCCRDAAKAALTRAIKADRPGARWLIPGYLMDAAAALHRAGRHDLADRAEALSGRIGICGADVEHLL